MSDQLLASLTAQLKKLGSTGDKSGPPTPKLLPGERREIAILFLDLKGFTALSEKLNDPEAINSIINGPHGIMTVLHKIVEHHGGYVDKYEGDLVMALFGAKQASENDSYLAVSCGMKLVEAVKTLDDAVSGLGIRIGARCGINFGWVTFGPDPTGHHTAMGTAVNVASRMESTAAVNTVQVTSSVVKLTHDHFIWEDLGGVEVKGVSKPIHTYRLIGFGDIHKARWERTSWMQSVPIIGRDSELEFIKERWKALDSPTEINPRGGVKHTMIGLRGDPGCGKSRLVFEFLKHIRSHHEITLLRGHTMSVAQPPFYLWANLFRNFFRITDDKSELARFEQLYYEFGSAYGLSENPEYQACFPFLCHILGFESEELSELSDQVLYQQSKLAIRNLFQILADHLPRIVFFLDDLHWLDSGSQEILEFMITNCDSFRPMFFLATFRPDRDDGQRLTLDLREAYVDYHERVIVPLTLEQAQHHVSSMLMAYSSSAEPVKLNKTIIERIFEFSQGNPFYTEEFVLDWLESGTLHFKDEHWRLTDSGHGDLPNSITSLVRARVDRLPHEEKQVLQQCSVMGLDFSLKLFQSVKTKLSHVENAEPLLNGLVFRDFLRNITSLKETSYKFKLTISRTVAYQTLLKENRSLIHRLTAESLEEILGNDAEYFSGVLAEHWYHAGDLTKSLEYGSRAVKQLRRAWHNREAAKMAENILDWFPRYEDMVHHQLAKSYYDLLSQLEGVYAILGKRSEQKLILDRLSFFVEMEHFSGHTATVENRIGNYLYLIGDIDGAAIHYQRSSELALEKSDAKTAALAIGNLGLIANHRGEIAEAEELLKAAIEQLSALKETHSVNVFEQNLAGIYFGKGEWEQCEQLLDSCRERSKLLHDRSAEGRLSSNLVKLQVRMGNIATAIETCRNACQIYNEIGERRSEGLALANLANLFRRNSETDKAREFYHMALSIHREVNDRNAEEKTLQELNALETK